MTAFTAIATLGGGNTMLNPLSSQEFFKDGPWIRHRIRNIYKIDYTHDSPDYGVQWKMINPGQLNISTNYQRNYGSVSHSHCGWGMVIRMLDESNYYVAYIYNHPYGPNLNKRNVSNEGEGYYVDKVVNGVPTNLYHYNFAVADSMSGSVPYTLSFWAEGDQLHFAANYGSINWSTTDTSLTGIGSAGVYFMSWGVPPPPQCYRNI